MRRRRRRKRRMRRRRRRRRRREGREWVERRHTSKLYHFSQIFLGHHKITLQSFLPPLQPAMKNRNLNATNRQTDKQTER